VRNVSGKATGNGDGFPEPYIQCAQQEAMNDKKEF